MNTYLYGIMLFVNGEVETMKDIVVVYPVKETAQAIANLIEKSGFRVSHICALGSSALEISQQKRRGVIVCPFVMRDMSASDLAEILPVDFDVVALSKNGSEQYMGNMITLPLPIEKEMFIQTISVLASSRSSFTKRTDDEADCISKAKEVLIAVKGMNECQAHKFLQSESMKTGRKISAVAMGILDEFA